MEDKECPKAFKYFRGTSTELFYTFLGFKK